MATLPELLLEHGIRPRSYRAGAHKLLCPKCSHRRKHRADPCLSLTIEREEAVWNCHNCNWSGAVSERDTHGDRQSQHRRPSSPTRPKAAPEQPTSTVLQWLADRGISEAVARRNRIGSRSVFIPALKAEVDCVCFPYYRDGELVNIK